MSKGISRKNRYLKQTPDRDEPENRKTNETNNQFSSHIPSTGTFSVSSRSGYGLSRFLPHRDMSCFIVLLNRRLLDPDISLDHPTSFVQYLFQIITGSSHQPPLVVVCVQWGHIAPNCALEQGNEGIGMITTSTPRTRGVYFHRKAMPKARYRELRAYFESRGVPALREADLENLNP